MHPGVLATDSFRDYPVLVTKIINLFLEKPHKGGERIAHLAVSNEVQELSGKYFYKTEAREIEIPDQSSETTERLLHLAKELTGLV
jgi:hypothetical protein